jgi:hypothetical protein
MSEAPQVCIPSIHKATSGTRFLRRKDFQKEWIPADDLKKDVHHLHTITRVGPTPLTAAELRPWVQDFFDCTGEWPDTCVSPKWGLNRTVAMYFAGHGVVSIRFEQGETWELRKEKA